MTEKKKSACRGPAIPGVGGGAAKGLVFRLRLLLAGSLAGLLLVSCGGGGGFPGDISISAPTSPAVTGANSFLQFPNPQLQPDGTSQIDSPAFAQAYYAAIDPANQKTTLDAWKLANGFGSGSGTEVTVVFGDIRDLGYGRRMTARQNVDGTIAVMVQNYLVEPASGYAYNQLNLEAAVVQDARWLIGTSALEFSPVPPGTVSFVKFFAFDPATGARMQSIDMDGRGEKAMPGPCITCHGGRGDPLTPPGPGGVPLFPLLQNTVSMARGDVQARMHPLVPGDFDFWSAPGFTRADQEAAIKVINRMVLCSYPLAGAAAGPEDACRRAATQNEWRGTAAALIKNAYGGDGLPAATHTDTYLPASWPGGGQTTLYRDSVVPACRTCHILMGTGRQSDIDFDTLAKFQGYGDRTKVHVYDRGNMPLGRIIAETFFGTNMADIMATFLGGLGFTVRDGGGAVLRPGRPVADPGPDRTVPQGATQLSAAASLFSTAFQWSVVSGPNGATPPTNVVLANPGSAQPVFTATSDGTYVLQLVTSNGGVQSSPAQLQIVVNNALAPPSTIRFADIKTVFTGAGCTACHNATALTPISFLDGVDRNGDAVVDATDDLWFFTEVRGRINFSDIVASPLLRKPSGSHHNGGLLAGFDATAAPGQPARSNYDLFLNWILSGAPQ